MYEVIFLFALSLIWIIFASVQDLRKNEIPDWISFSLVIFALGFRFFYSLFSSEGLGFFYQGLIGFGIFFIIGNILYYGRVFAGGDAKLMIALGAVIPFSLNFFYNLKLFGLFILLFLFSGGIYGFVWSCVLSIKNFDKVRKDFYKRFHKNRLIVYFSLIVSFIFILSGIYELLLVYIGVLISLFPILYFYGKATEEVCMVKIVKTSELTEGDWLYETVKIGNKKIEPTWEGLSKKDILLIKKKLKKIKIKQGIPFAPVFFISFVLLFLFYKWFKIWEIFF